MPHDLVTVRGDVVRDAAGHDMVLVTKYEAPAGDADPETGQFAVQEDPFKEYDIWVANRAIALLKDQYPGHFWCVVADHRHGIIKISIPILMGVTTWYVINLKTHELTPGLIIVAGGEILERYSLSRERFNLGAFLEARRKHSKLLVANRPIPA